MGRNVWIVLTILLLAGAVASSALWRLTAFVFEAPGSESNPLTWFMAIALYSVSPLFVAGAVLPWVLRGKPWAGRLFIVPLLGIGACFLAVMALNAGCNGSFSCG